MSLTMCREVVLKRYNEPAQEPQPVCIDIPEAERPLTSSESLLYQWKMFQAGVKERVEGIDYDPKNTFIISAPGDYENGLLSNRVYLTTPINSTVKPKQQSNSFWSFDWIWK